MFFRGVKGVRNNWFSVFCYLLVGISGIFGEFLFKVEKVFEELVVLFGGSFGLGNFKIIGNGIGIFIRFMVVDLIKVLIFDGSIFGFGVDVVRGSGIVGFVEGVIFSN